MHYLIIDRYVYFLIVDRYKLTYFMSTILFLDALYNIFVEEIIQLCELSKSEFNQFICLFLHVTSHHNVIKLTFTLSTGNPQRRKVLCTRQISISTIDNPFHQHRYNSDRELGFLTVNVQQMDIKLDFKLYFKLDPTHSSLSSDFACA